MDEMRMKNWIRIWMCVWLGVAGAGTIGSFAQNPPDAAETDGAAEETAATAIRFQFNGMPYMSALERFSQMTGKPLLSNTNIEGTITFNDSKTYTYDEALDTLNLILSMKSMMLVEDDRFLRLVSFDKINQMPLRIFRGSNQTGDVRPGEIVTVVMDLKHLDPGEVSQSATPMLSSAGSMAPLSRGRSLIITDRMANIRRIQELIAKIDTESSVDRQMRTYALQHASGSVVTDLINRTFGESTAPKRTVFNQKSNRYDELSPDPNDYVTAVYDEASRTLVMFGPRGRIELAEELLQQFEDKQAGQGSDVRLYYPKAVSAQELSRMVREAVPGVAAPNETASSASTKARLTVDSAQNRLIVTAPTAAQLESIDKVIETLDSRAVGVNPGEPKDQGQTTKIFPARASDPASLSQVITDALSQRNRAGELEPRVQVTVEPRTRSLIVSGSSGDLNRVSEILAQLESAALREEEHETRFISVGSVSETTRLAPLVEQLFEQQVPAAPGQPSPARILPDPPSGRLIVTASPSNLDLIESLITKLQADRLVLRPRVLEIYALEHVKVADVVPSLRDLVAERMKEPDFQNTPAPSLLADAPGNRVLVTASERQHAVVRELVEVLDVAPAAAQRELSVVPVRFKTASDIIGLVNQLIGPGGEVRTDAQSPPRFMADPSGRKIMVLAVREDVPKIRGLIERLDGSGQPAAERSFRTVELYRRKTEEFTPMVSQLYQEQLKGQPEPEGGSATLLAETKSNRIMVSGPEAEIAKVESIIRQLDPVDRTAGQEETRVIRLVTAVATDLVGVVEKSLSARQNRATILVDARSNSLVVTGDPESVKAAADLVQQLDTNPYLQPRQLRIFNLKAGDAGALAPMVTDLFTQMIKDQRGPNYVPPTQIVADTTGNRLLVTGLPDEIELIATFVEKLDEMPEEASGARVIPLQTADARELAPIVSSAMTRYDANNRPITRVSVSADDDSNSLVVSGPRADVQEAESVIQKLDSQARPSGRTFKIIPVESSDPSRLASLASRIFADQTRGRRGRDTLSITADDDGRRLIVMAPQYLVEQVEGVVKVLDREPTAPGRALRMVDVSNGRAADILSTVNQIYTDQTRDSAEQRATIMTGGNPSQLAVIGNDAQVALIESIVQTLQAGAETSPRETKVFDLGKQSEAQRVMPLVQQLYQDQLKNEPSAGTADAQFLTDGTTGRVIVSARRDHLARIETLFQRFEPEVKLDESRQTRTFEVGSPEEATRVSTLLSQLYQDQWKGRNPNDPADAQFLPDSKAGRLYVTGRPAHLELIAGLLEELGTAAAPTQPMETRVYELNAASADELADTVERIYTEQLKVRSDTPVLRTMILPDAAANRLVVAGLAAELEAVDKIVAKLDQVSRQTAGTRVFHLKSSEAQQVGAILSSALTEILPNGRTVPRVSVGADNKSNTLIVSGEPKDIQSAAVIIEQLDNVDPKEPRRLEIIALKTGLASDLATQVRQLYLDQMKGQPDMRAADATIIGDDNGNRLILTGAETQLEMIRGIVARLDEKQESTGRQLRVINLDHQSASAVSSVLSQLFAKQIASPDPGQQLVVSAAPDDRTLIVDANDPTLGRIETLVRTLDAEEAITNTVFQTVRVKQVGADDVAEAVTAALASRYPAGKSGRLLVVPVDNADSILLHGAEKDVAEAVQIIREIDEESEAMGIEVRMYRLENGQVREVSAILEQLFQTLNFSRARRSGGNSSFFRRSRFVDPSQGSIQVDERNNRLIVMGTEAHFKLVEEFLPKLDQVPERADRDIAYIWLENMQADLVAEQVEDLFVDRARAERPLVNFDLLDNVLTVVGRRNDLDEIRSIVERLDAGALDTTVQVRMIPVGTMAVSEVADMLKNIYPQMSGGTISIVDKLPPLPPKSQKETTPPPSDPPPTEAPPSDPPNADPAQADASPSPARHVVVAIDKDANALLVSGPAHELDRIDSLVTELAFSAISTESEFRQFPLQEADPVLVARTLNELFKREPIQVQEDGKPKTITPAPKITVVAETRTRSIIARGSPSDFKLLEALIERLDAKGVTPPLDFRVFVLEHAQPEKVLPLVQQWVTQLNTLRPGEPVSVMADPRDRGLFVVAHGSALEEIGRVIASLDTASDFADAEVLMIPLRNANANQLTAVLQAMLRPGAQGELTPEARELQEQVHRLRVRNEAGEAVHLDLTQPIKIMADPVAGGPNGGNRLILTSTPDNLQALSAVVDMLDRVPLTEGVTVRIFHLEQADASTVSQTLNTVFQQGAQLAVGPAGRAQPEGSEGKALVHPVSVAVDARSNTLIVSGRNESLALAERIINDLDREQERFITEVKLFRLKHASATKLAPMIQNVFAETGTAPAAEGLNTQVTKLKTNLEEEEPKETAHPKTRAALVVQADDTSNILIVAARSDVLPLIEDVIDKMDIPSASGLDTLRIYPLTHADAASVQAVIDDLFNTSRVPNLRVEDRPNVTVDPRSNALIISGNQKAFAIIDSLVAQLDQQQVAEKTMFKVYNLSQATATKLQGTLRTLFAQRVPRIKGQSVEPITVVADAWANALIVGASPEDMPMVSSLIERLDSGKTEAGAEIEIMPLRKADARRVAETVQGLYRDGASTAAPVAVNVDDRLNALVVSAGEADRKRIAELVKKLDTDAVARVSEIRILPLKNARADSMATILNTALNANPGAANAENPAAQSMLQFITRTEEGEELVTSSLRERVSITPDARMNSLIVTGPLDYMPLLQQIVNRLDTQSPQLAKIKVFTLQNADADLMADVLTSVFRLRLTGGQTAAQQAVQYTLVKPAADPAGFLVDGSPEGPSVTLGTVDENALSVTVDPRTNSLLVGGTDPYMSLAEEIIETLDASPVQERHTEVYRLRNAQALEVETALRSFLDQDRQRVLQALGQDALGTAQRMLEREVAIVAEPISNSLLISANPRYFTNIVALVKELDQPLPQVLIQALIAEATLDSTTELGVEWNYNGVDGSKTYGVGTDFGVADALSSFGGFSSAVTGSDYSFLLRALQSDGRLNVLSRPQILTADNQPATINVGQRVPLITNSRVTENDTVINSVDYQTVGVILTVTPRISPDGFVRMDVGTTNSALSTSNVQISENASLPIINERLATTTVSVQSGQSIIIGGLISSMEDTRSKRIPFLGNIPLLGALFRTSSDFKDRKELLIFLTPQVLVKLEDEQGEVIDGRTMTRRQLDRSGIKEQIDENLREQNLWQEDRLNPRIPSLDPAFETDESEPLL